MSNSTISLTSQKQPTVALSTAEDEYIALCFAAKESVLLRRQLCKDLQIHCSGPITIHKDNQGTIAMSKNPILQKRTKHIDIKFHFVREKIQDKTIELKYCPTHEMVPDISQSLYGEDNLKSFKQNLDLSWYSNMLSVCECWYLHEHSNIITLSSLLLYRGCTAISQALTNVLVTIFKCVYRY